MSLYFLVPTAHAMSKEYFINERPVKMTQQHEEVREVSSMNRLSQVVLAQMISDLFNLLFLPPIN
jgi:hypothetical protein